MDFILLLSRVLLSNIGLEAYDKQSDSCDARHVVLDIYAMLDICDPAYNPAQNSAPVSKSVSHPHRSIPCC